MFISTRTSYLRHKPLARFSPHRGVPGARNKESGTIVFETVPLLPASMPRIGELKMQAEPDSMSLIAEIQAGGIVPRFLERFDFPCVYHIHGNASSHKSHPQHERSQIFLGPKPGRSQNNTGCHQQAPGNPQPAPCPLQCPQSFHLPGYIHFRILAHFLHQTQIAPRFLFGYFPLCRQFSQTLRQCMESACLHGRFLHFPRFSTKQDLIRRKTCQIDVFHLSYLPVCT